MQDLDRNDAKELLALHQTVLAAHRNGDVELLLRDETDAYVVASRGQVTQPGKEARRQRLGPYLAATTFDVYRDQIPPTVRVSQDGSLGWVIAQIYAQGSQVVAGGAREPLTFVCAWIELYEKKDGRWLRTGNVSNFKP
jgi:hypothetical protein